MKKIVISFCLFLLCSWWSSECRSEEISLDTMIYSSCEIYPFDHVERITGLSWLGSIRFLSDTSLVRMVLTSQEGYEYMIYESYPLIEDGSFFDVQQGCDETCFLDQLNPVSVKIQIINSELSLKSLFYTTEYQDFLPQLQLDAKRARDEEKIVIMNERIPDYNMNWVAVCVFKTICISLI